MKKGKYVPNYGTVANGLFIVHRRLSITDLSPAGHKPMSYDDGMLRALALAYSLYQGVRK